MAIFLEGSYGFRIRIKSRDISAPPGAEYARTHELTFVNFAICAQPIRISENGTSVV